MTLSHPDRTKIAIASLTALLAIGVSASLAEPAQPAAAPTAEPSAVHTMPLIDLQMPEITVRDYVDYLANVSGGNFILLNDPHVDPAQVKVPALKLKQMSVESALKVLTALPGEHIEVEQSPGATIPSYLITMHAAPAAPGFVPDEVPSTKIATRLFPLERLLVPAPAETSPADAAQHTKDLDTKVDQLLQLVDLTIATQDGNLPRPLVKLHAPTHTLLVKGTAPQIDAVEQAIKALTIEPSEARAQAEAEKLQTAFAKMETISQSAKANDQMLRTQLAELKAQNDALKQALTEGRNSSSRLHDAGPSTQPAAPSDVH